MSQALIIYTFRPEGVIARAFAQFLSADNRVVKVLPLSALPQPTPLSWLEKRRAQLLREQQDLREAIGGLEMGIALATGAPHRFPEGPMWAAEKHTHERRLRVVAWKLEKLAEQEGSTP
jgi:hypothetical protein